MWPGSSDRRDGNDITGKRAGLAGLLSKGFSRGPMRLDACAILRGSVDI